jgi:hypothetical protein
VSWYYAAGTRVRPPESQRLLRIEQLLAAGIDPAAAFALIQRLRHQADKYERDLIRSLRWGADGRGVRTCAEVALAIRRSWAVAKRRMPAGVGSSPLPGGRRLATPAGVMRGRGRRQAEELGARRRYDRPCVVLRLRATFAKGGLSCHRTTTTECPSLARTHEAPRR